MALHCFSFALYTTSTPYYAVFPGSTHTSPIVLEEVYWGRWRWKYVGRLICGMLRCTRAGAPLALPSECIIPCIVRRLINAATNPSSDGTGRVMTVYVGSWRGARLSGLWDGNYCLLCISTSHNSAHQPNGNGTLGDLRQMLRSKQHVQSNDRHRETGRHYVEALMMMRVSIPRLDCRWVCIHTKPSACHKDSVRIAVRQCRMEKMERKCA